MTTNNASLADILANDILNDKYFVNLLSRTEKICAYQFFQIRQDQSELSNNEVIHLLKYGDILSHSNNPKARNFAYKIVSALAENYSHHEYFGVFSKAILTKLGNFPGVAYLTELFPDLPPLPYEREIESTIKTEVQKVPHEEIIFTDAQYQIFQNLKNNNHFSYSGPTSLGKSFIIESFVKYLALREGIAENVVILVPTRALINQVSLKLKKSLASANDYKILTHPIVPEFFKKKPSGYIFVFTPERLLLFLSNKNNPKIEYLIIDEAQKIISEKDTRSPLYYHAILQAEKKSIKLFFSSPNIPNPEVFLQLFEKSTEEVLAIKDSPVAQNRYFLDLIDHKAVFYSDSKGEISIPIDVGNDGLYYWLNYLGKNEKNIVYCNTIEDTIEYARAFSKDLSPKNDPRIQKLIELIKASLHKDYFLIDCLKKGVGFHFGKLPQRIRVKLEELFREKVIDWIFCTSTLLEGVNMPAKNIFILSNAIGLSKFTDIDFWNLAGRAGRLTKDLSGNIVCLRAVVKGNRWDNPDKDLTIVKDMNVKPLEPILIKGHKNFFKNVENSILNNDYTSALHPFIIQSVS